VAQFFVRKEERSRGVTEVFKAGGGELVAFDGGNDFVHAGAAFFADAGAAHEEGKDFIAGAGRFVEEAVGADERGAGVGDFHAGGEDFYHGAGAGDGKILVDERVGDEFADGFVGIYRNVAAQSSAYGFGAREERVGVVDYGGEAGGVACADYVFADGFEAVVAFS